MTGALFLAVGIPACGKSTFAERWLKTGTIDLIVSSDQIRQEIAGDITSQERNRDVFQIMHERVGRALHDGQSVFVDATNLNPDYREPLRQMATANDAHAEAIIFHITFDEACERNNRRDRVVPQLVMDRMQVMFLQHCSVEQLTSEGWTVRLA